MEEAEKFRERGHGGKVRIGAGSGGRGCAEVPKRTPGNAAEEGVSHE